MALAEYNGFTEKERNKGERIIKKAEKEGRLTDRHATICKMCGQDKGVREYHAEDYSPDKILDDVIPLCWRCHRHIHRKNKGPKWHEYEEMLKRGERAEPFYWKWWHEEDDLPVVTQEKTE